MRCLGMSHIVIFRISQATQKCHHAKCCIVNQQAVGFTWALFLYLLNVFTFWQSHAALTVSSFQLLWTTDLQTTAVHQSDSDILIKKKKYLISKQISRHLSYLNIDQTGITRNIISDSSCMLTLRRRNLISEAKCIHWLLRFNRDRLLATNKAF